MGIESFDDSCAEVDEPLDFRVELVGVDVEVEVTFGVTAAGVDLLEAELSTRTNSGTGSLIAATTAAAGRQLRQGFRFRR